MSDPLYHKFTVRCVNCNKKLVEMTAPHGLLAAQIVAQIPIVGNAMIIHATHHSVPYHEYQVMLVDQPNTGASAKP